MSVVQNSYEHSGSSTDTLALAESERELGPGEDDRSSSEASACADVGADESIEWKAAVRGIAVVGARAGRCVQVVPASASRSQ